MEKKTHILFTITWIYWLATLFKNLWWDNSFILWYISIVSAFPLISIPFQAIATTIPDSDGKTRLRKTILAPAVFLINLITSHRWATHDIRWIAAVWVWLYWLYLLWTNIITLILISFFAITITLVMIDDLRISFFWIVNIKTKIVEYILSWIILIFFPILLIPEVYNAFLISLFFAYVWHMLWDMPSKEWWKPLISNKIKLQLPGIFSFRVWWFIERNIIAPMLIILLISVIWIDKEFWWNKMIKDLSLVKNQYIKIIEEPEILINDYSSFKSKNEKIMNFFK